VTPLPIFRYLTEMVGTTEHCSKYLVPATIFGGGCVGRMSCNGARSIFRSECLFDFSQLYIVPPQHGGIDCGRLVTADCCNVFLMVSFSSGKVLGR
jgi:hypothetical protein